MGQVYQLLTMCSEKELNGLFDLLPVTHPAKAPYNIFRQANDTVRTGVIIGLGSRLQIFQNKLIRQITSYDETNLTRPDTKNVPISAFLLTRILPLIFSHRCL